MCNMKLVSNVNPWNELTIFQPVTKKQKQNSIVNKNKNGIPFHDCEQITNF